MQTPDRRALDALTTTGLGPVPVRLTEAALTELAHLLPPSAAAMQRTLGTPAALALLNGLPGVQLLVPKRPDSSLAALRRWELLQGLVGEAAMPAVVALYGGNMLEVPICGALLREMRNRWLRARFDELLRHELCQTKAAAVYELGIELAGAGCAMTYRQIEMCIDQGDLTAVALAQRRAAQDLAAAAGQGQLWPPLELAEPGPPAPWREPDGSAAATAVHHPA